MKRARKANTPDNKRKRGRPPARGVIATADLRARVTPAEHEAASAAAKRRGQPLADFVRDAVAELTRKTA
jgi:predicted HicB family RNase H-like nuclease